jgi:predicted lipase
MIKALKINASFIRSLFDSTIKQADVLIYASADPTLAMAGVYYDIDGDCWLTIRGTMTGADISADLNDSQQLITSSGEAVHAGMYNIYSEIKPTIMSTLASKKNIYICGHSLGAALSIYAGYDLPNSTVYAFAPPRTGNLAFAAATPSTITSIINLADIVPTLPWSYTFDNLQYAHVGKIVTFNNTGKNILDCHNLLTYYNGLINDS